MKINPFIKLLTNLENTPPPPENYDFFRNKLNLFEITSTPRKKIESPTNILIPSIVPPQKKNHSNKTSTLNSHHRKNHIFLKNALTQLPPQEKKISLPLKNTTPIPPAKNCHPMKRFNSTLKLLNQSRSST